MVVGKRSGGVGILYSVIEVLFLAIVLWGWGMFRNESDVRVLLLGLVFLGVTGVILFRYFTTPAEAIILNEDNSIYLAKFDLTLSMEEIRHISYKRARAKGIEYKWGKVIIETDSKKYKTDYLSYCEEVADTLNTALMEYRVRR